jgi:O-antigen ligase
VTDERLREQLAGAVQVLTAALVLSLGLAAGNSYPWNIPVGRPLRWIVLAELLAAALSLAFVSRRGRIGTRMSLLLGGFLGLALLSAGWSVDFTLTVGRFATVATVFAVAVVLAVVAAVRRELVEVVLLGLVAGVVLLAVIGLLELWHDPDRALAPATTQSAARYNGIGGNPNTMAILIALVIPIVVGGVLTARDRARRVVSLAVLALLYGSLVASGSRGALLGALGGTLVFAMAAPLVRRARVQLAAVAVALAAVGVLAIAIPQPAQTNPVIPFDIVPPSTPPLSPLDVQPKLPLESEVGLPGRGEEPFTRTLFTSSGRVDAWRGALEQAFDRPLLGYGFGTEERVFVDRYYLHYSQRPENAYIGTLLQLGLVGLVVLLAVLTALVLRIRLVRDAAVAACAGAVVCGLVLAVSQSYLTSVGSPAMVPFWFAALLLVGATEPQAANRLGDREGREREVEASQRDAEPSLDVVRSEQERVDGEEDDDAPGRTASPHGEYRAD